MRIEKAKKMRLYLAQVVKRALSSTELFDSAISRDKSMIKSATKTPLISSVPRLKATVRWPGGLLIVITILTRAPIKGRAKVLHRSI